MRHKVNNLLFTANTRYEFDFAVSFQSEFNAFIDNDRVEPFPGLETKDDIAEYLATQTFFDIRDAEVFINTVTNTEYGLFWEGGRSAIETSINATTSVTQILESMQNQYDQLVEDYLVTIMPAEMQYTENDPQTTKHIIKKITAPTADGDVSREPFFSSLF